MRDASQDKKRPSTQFRFINEEHRNLVQDAARAEGLSVNAWIVKLTLQAARRQALKD